MPRRLFGTCYKSLLSASLRVRSSCFPYLSAVRVELFLRSLSFTDAFELPYRPPEDRQRCELPYLQCHPNWVLCHALDCRRIGDVVFVAEDNSL
jgi:hypothetical protein